jgi:hypothetical protein
MKKTWQQKQKESIQSGYSQAKQLAEEIWIGANHEGTPNDFYYFQCGFVAGLNYQRLQALDKLSQLDQEMGLE